jgi:hypothetical protein
MSTAQELVRRVDSLLQPWTPQGAKAQEQLRTPKDVKRAITELGQVQKELRLIKKEIVLGKKEIRAEYAGARAGVSKGAVGNRFVGGGFFGMLARAGTCQRARQPSERPAERPSTIRGLEAHIEEKL